MNGQKSVIAIVISIFSLFISGISLWQTFFSPFNAQVVLGSMMWKTEELEEKPGAPKVRSLIMVTEVHFVNKGAKPGQLDLLEILLERKADIKKWRFFPAVFITYGEFIRHLGQIKDKEARDSIIDKVLEGPFTPPFLQGKQSLTKAIVFVPPSGFPFSIDELKQGEYLIHLNSIKGNNVKELQIVAFRITRDELEVIESRKGQVIPIHR